MTAHFQRASVLGAGTMGHGIAHTCAAAGLLVTLYDVDLGAVEAGFEHIKANLDKGVSLEKITPEDRDATLGRIELTSELAYALEHTPLVIEAAPESIELKLNLYRLVELRVGEDTVFATNTSSLSITRLAAGLEAPGRFIGMHFFNPAHIMKLVEVVTGDQTSDETTRLAVDFVRFIGRDPIVVQDSPGFASSRLGIILGLEAIRMVEAGVASPKDIDKAMTLGYRHPMGPLKLTDLVGLDVRLNIAEYLHRALESEAFRPPDLLKCMVGEGKLGKKSGEGFYRWEES
jgi:3-hydroxybutyryl-CoA dehydrogenase